MGNNSQISPPYAGVHFKSINVTPDDSDGTINTVPAGAKSVFVVAVTNDADDYILLPLLKDVQEGHEINIQCGAGTDFEMRCPDNSAEKINNVDCGDGAVEYLCTDGEVLRVIKIDNTIGWMAHAYDADGNVVTAVTPN